MPDGPHQIEVDRHWVANQLFYGFTGMGISNHVPLLPFEGQSMIETIFSRPGSTEGMGMIYLDPLVRAVSPPPSARQCWHGHSIRQPQPFRVSQLRVNATDSPS